MTSVPPNPRYERKFVAEGFTLPEVLALVRRHRAGFREAYPTRSVNTLYLDSPDLRDYHDHVNGVPHRSKTRIRWYGEWAGRIETPTLEQKLKVGPVSGKVSHRLPALSLNGHPWGFELGTAFDAADLPALVRLALGQLQPSLLNRYRRHYFQSPDGRFRLTVDSGLQFAAARPVCGTGNGFAPATAPVVIEVKYGLAATEAASPVTSALPFRLARCSKYVLGISSLAKAFATD